MHIRLYYRAFKLGLRIDKQLVNQSLRFTALMNSLDQCSACTTLARGYRHVPGGGCVYKPDVMFILINPTVGNISAHADWNGPRFPFASKPAFWRILAETGFVGSDLPQRMNTLGPTPAMVEMLVAATQQRRLYLTNAVKCVDDGSSLPPRTRVADNWPVLQQEIDCVQPRLIVAMGLIPFGVLTGRQVRLADQLWAAEHGAVNFFASRPIVGRTFPVFPCYFPTGRGNPVAATKMLRALRAWLHTHLL